MNGLRSPSTLKLGFIFFGSLAFVGGFLLTGYLILNTFSSAQTGGGAKASASKSGTGGTDNNPQTPLNETEKNKEALEDEKNVLNMSELNMADVPIVFQSNVDYKYDPISKRDPFKPYRNAKVGMSQVIARNRPTEPLEEFDVKSLQVVAIVWGNSKPRALIMDPTKKVHSVSKGQRLGKNEGFVAEIREGEVVVVELFDLNGKVVKEPVVLTIKK